MLHSLNTVDLMALLIRAEADNQPWDGQIAVAYTVIERVKSRPSRYGDTPKVVMLKPMQCSFLDLEPVRHHEKYQGKRIKRGLFRSSMGKLINADLNGAYNIIRKVAPEAFSQGVEGVVVHPLPLQAKTNRVHICTSI